MDFGDETFDDSGHTDDLADDEPVDGPLLSEIFKTCSQEQQHHQHTHAAWKEQMPILVDAYLAWKHEAPAVADILSHLLHSMSMLLGLWILHTLLPLSNILMNQQMQPSFM
ncbi:hypothetical protein BDR07DRAFT_1482032 [Suillus spraguei]|nr:hypothetical protein BDR07DRAFT_1482032 [Suillus spraguei]